MMTQSEKKARFGIRIKVYCAEHESYITDKLDGDTDCKELLGLHERKIAWLQHERLVHLIVLFIIAALFLFTIWLFIALGNPLVLILLAVVFVLLAGYIRHYFFLENTVQRWYMLWDRIYERTR